MDVSLDDYIKTSKRGGRGNRRGGGGGRGGGQNGVSNGNSTGGRRRSAPTRQNARSPAAQNNYRRGNMDGRWSHDLYQERGAEQMTPRRQSGGGSGVTKLMISNLDFGVTDSDIQELFGEFGAVRAAAVHYDRSSRSLGTAHVVFERRNDAVRAMKQYGGVPLDGRAMKLELATSQLAPSPAAFEPSQSRDYARRRGGAASTGRAPRGGGRGGAGGRGGVRRGGGPRGGGRGGKQKTPTAEELDAELDDYIKSAK